MSELPILPRPSRGLRIGAVSALVAVAFLLGIGLALVLARRQIARDLAADAGFPRPGTTAPVIAPPPADPAALTARQAALAGQVAALEARAGTLAASAQAAGGQATRAESLLTAIAARRAIDRGQGLGALDEQLVRRFGATQPGAVEIVRAAGRQPVTLEELRQGLDAIGPAAVAGVGDGWWATLRRELGQLVVVRRAGTPSPRPRDHLARARRLLDSDQVEAARAEVAQLPGADDAGNWLTAARRYALARQALDALETAALTVPNAIPAPNQASPVALPMLPPG